MNYLRNNGFWYFDFSVMVKLNTFVTIEIIQRVLCTFSMILDMLELLMAI